MPGSIAGLDGMEIDLVTTRWMQYHVGADSLTGNVVLWPRSITFVMNQTAFDTLTSRQQGALRQAGAIAAERLLARIHEDEQALLCAGGGLRLAAASGGELAALRDAVRPVYAELEQDDLTRELIEEIRELRRGGNRDGPTPPSCEDKQTGTVTADPRVLGRSQVRLTEQELLDAGIEPALATQLAGTWVRRHEPDGRWVTRRLSSDAVFSGTYVMEADVGTYTTLSCHPRAWCAPGAVDEYTWSVYEDRLTYAVIPGRPYEAANVIKPWRRVR